MKVRQRVQSKLKTTTKQQQQQTTINGRGGGARRGSVYGGGGGGGESEQLNERSKIKNARLVDQIQSNLTSRSHPWWIRPNCTAT